MELMTVFFSWELPVVVYPSINTLMPGMGSFMDRNDGSSIPQLIHLLEVHMHCRTRGTTPVYSMLKHYLMVIHTCVYLNIICFICTYLDFLYFPLYNVHTCNYFQIHTCRYIRNIFSLNWEFDVQTHRTENIMHS